jgi:hypothetical protein
VSSVRASRGNDAAWRGAAPKAINGLAFAASPAFALMGLLTAIGTPEMPFCASAPSFLPIDGMTAMYMLMSFFHASPWLRLACRP